MTGAPAAFRSALAGVVLVAVALFAVPLGWGIDGETSWAVDELAPHQIEDARRQGFAEGWNHYYPPMLVYASALVGEVAGIGGFETRELARMRLATRFVSLAAATLTVLLVAIVGLRLGLDSGALVAAFLWSASPLVVYFAKTANVESLYLLFLGLALLLLVRYRDSGRFGWLAGTALAAACAAATKDQAAVYFALLPAVLLLPTDREAAEAATAISPRRRGAHAAAAAAIGLGAYALALNLPANSAGVRAHFARLRRVAETAPEFAATPSGKLAQLAQIAVDLAFVLGPAAVVLAAIGAARLVARGDRRRPHLPHLLLAGGYAGFFWLALPRSYARFTLPLALSGALLAGEGWGAALAWGRDRFPRWIRPLLALLLLASLARGVELDLRLLFDSRALVGRFIEHDGGDESTTWIVSKADWLPSCGQRVAFRKPAAFGRLLAEHRPLHVVGESALLDEPGWRNMLVSRGYREVWRSDGPVPAVLSHPRWARSNLDKISRELVVWKLAPSAEPSP